jgi:O-antigen ligase
VLGVFLLVEFALLFKSGKGRAWLMIAPLALVPAIGFAPQDLIRERIGSIGPAFQGMLGTAGGRVVAGGDSRGFHWAVGLAMFRDHPLLGTGYNNFGRHFFVYQHRVPNPDQTYIGIRSPHSSYIAFLANQGLLGVSVWLAFFAMSGIAAIRLWMRFKPERNSREYLMVQALTVTLFLQFLYGWSMVVHQDKFLWLVLGLLAAAWNLGNERPSQDVSHPVSAEVIPPLRMTDPVARYTT